jgi:hypothetical protein
VYPTFVFGARRASFDTNDTGEGSDVLADCTSPPAQVGNKTGNLGVSSPVQGATVQKAAKASPSSSKNSDGEVGAESEMVGLTPLGVV